MPYHRTHGLDSDQPRTQRTLNVLAIFTTAYIVVALAASAAYYFNF